MRDLLRFLFENPILLFIVVAWIAGAIGNAVKAARKQQRQQQPAPPVRTRPAAPQAGPRTADEVAAEIRRALGLDPPQAPPRPAPPPTPAPRPVAPPPAPARPAAWPEVSRREAPSPERPPTPVVPTTQARKLEMHVVPHVGEQIQRRAAVKPATAAPRGIGELGGRSTAPARRAAGGSSRYALDDLKRAFVLAEILGPPLASRPERDV